MNINEYHVEADPEVAESYPLPHYAEARNAEDLIRGRVTVGDFELTILTDGTYLVDGGAMFGVVPKTLWSERIESDPHNKLLLGTNILLIRNGRHTVIVETGIGNKLSDKMCAIYDVKKRLPASLSAAGIRVENVDVVINSHLHFDHCGWNTTRLPDGRVVPTFPNARYFVHAAEVARAHLQSERDRVSYIGANYDPLIANGQMTLLDLARGQTREIVPGIVLEMCPGHTASMMATMIQSKRERACCPADLIPTTAHLDPTWVMSYDLDPLTSIEEKKRLLKKAITERWLLLFTHDHYHPMGYVGVNDRGKPTLSPGASSE